MNTLELCEQVASHERLAAQHQAQADQAKRQLEDITGKSYNEFIYGMRRLMAPAGGENERPPERAGGTVQTAVDEGLGGFSYWEESARRRRET